jgi:hypothetical protein
MQSQKLSWRGIAIVLLCVVFVIWILVEIVNSADNSPSPSSQATSNAVEPSQQPVDNGASTGTSPSQTPTQTVATQQNPAPQAPAATWHTVLTYSGPDTPDTAPFTMRGSQWRVTYSCSLSGTSDPSASGLLGVINSVSDGDPVDDFNPHCPESNASYSYDNPPGQYALQVTSVNASYSITIEDYYSGASAATAPSQSQAQIPAQSATTQASTPVAQPVAAQPTWHTVYTVSDDFNDSTMATEGPFTLQGSETRVTISCALTYGASSGALAASLYVPHTSANFPSGAHCPVDDDQFVYNDVPAGQYSLMIDEISNGQGNGNLQSYTVTVEDYY